VSYELLLAPADVDVAHAVAHHLLDNNLAEQEVSVHIIKVHAVVSKLFIDEATHHARVKKREDLHHAIRQLFGQSQQVEQLNLSLGLLKGIRNPLHHFARKTDLTVEPFCSNEPKQVN
jgi:hypothetical protein